ncbi:MAG: sarcosine oxidase subunit alpha family protein [Pseudomonadota bacterium]
MSGARQSHGGLIDRSRTVPFTWNGQALAGHPGDTLASALTANGVTLVGRSFKYHRPRGIFAAGVEEPNALVQITRGRVSEPNCRATTTELYEGLTATSQNHVGPLHRDLMAVNDILSPFLGAGFYYKTFMWPPAFWERVYEPMIRRAAGLGELPTKPDPDCYDRGFLHCDVLIIGAGPAGLAAALAAGRAGARVILADEDFRIGGRLNAEDMVVDGAPGPDWTSQAHAELEALSNVRLLPRTTVFGAFDHGTYGAVERLRDHLPFEQGKARQIYWRIHAQRAVLAAGATERPIAFPNNDRPGIMLAGAVRTYLHRYGVAPGQRVAVFTNNDDGLRSAADLTAAGVEVVAVLDARRGDAVIDTGGRLALSSITREDGSKLAVDCLAVSGGWSPNVHLTCHHRGRPVWREDIAAFVPGPELPPGMVVAGAAAGDLTLGAGLRGGYAAGAQLAQDLGYPAINAPAPEGQDESNAITPIWQRGDPKRRAWVDLQNDVTSKDLTQAHREGFSAVEHAKRYTTLGMATDQGKTANVLGLALLARASGRSIEETGTTIFRPPYTPVTIGTLAGRARGKHFQPYRLTPSHGWAQENGADFIEVGQWLRAQWYRRPGELGWRDSVDREVRMTRGSVGVCDVSTLGKIDIQGRDTAQFLNRVYANGFAKLAVGRVRYGLMLREDGFVYDDGTTARLSDTHCVMTTTTANAALVYRNLEFARQCLWPDLDVHLTPVTDAWAQFSVAGPNARALLSELVEGLDLSNAGFPFMACAHCRVMGVPARLFRISFSGELAYEIAVPRRYGDALIRALMEAGSAYDAVPYGVEALNVMRIEKGHVTGAEINGQTTAQMLGMASMVRQDKDAFGTTLSQRPEMVARGGLYLVGLRPVDRRQKLNAGAHFLNPGEPADMAHDQGWMTSVAYSPGLGHDIGLGLVKRGYQRLGQRIRAYSPVQKQDVMVEICRPQHFDPAGERQRG